MNVLSALVTLSLAATSPARATTLDRYTAAIRALDGFTADLEIEDRGPTGEPALMTARVAAARPNRYSLTLIKDGVPVEHVVSDGRTLRQWDSSRISEDPAPPALDALAPSVLKASSALWPVAVLTLPEVAAGLRGFAENNGDQIDGIATHKMSGALHYGDEPGGLALWVDDASGLPRRVTTTYKKRTLTITFKDLRAGIPANAIFDERPAASATRTNMPANKDAPSIKVGATAPDFVLATVTGQKVSLSALRGKVVLLEFWAPWCPGCRLAAPTVSKVIGEQRARGVRAVQISTTATKTQLVEYLQEHMVQGQAVHDPAEQDEAVGYARYGITGFPSFVVVDAAGKVSRAWKRYSEGEFEVQLRAALNGARHATGTQARLDGGPRRQGRPASRHVVPQTP